MCAVERASGDGDYPYARLNHGWGHRGDQGRREPKVVVARTSGVD